MTSFELKVNERAFRRVGVEVEFDESTYSELLDDLSLDGRQFQGNQLPLQVELEPASTWGLSSMRKALVAHNDPRGLPSTRFIRSNNVLDVTVDENVSLANRTLLLGTRNMSGIISGEAAAARVARTPLRRAAIGAVPVATVVGAYEGNQHISGGGAIVGGVLGFTASLAAPIVEMARRPYRKELAQFVEDPEVLAKYGSIVRFHAIPWRGGSEA